MNLGVIRLSSDTLYDILRPGGEGPGFWWSVEFEAESGGDKNPAWQEERLFDLASISGAMGSELLEEEDRLVLRAAYRSSRELDGLLGYLNGLLADFPGVALRAHGKVENRPCLALFFACGFGFLPSSFFTQRRGEEMHCLLFTPPIMIQPSL